MPRPEGYEVSPETKAAIGESRRGKKLDAATKRKIGKGVRHGAGNKVVFNTRISREASEAIHSKKGKLPLSQAVEKAFMNWKPK